MDKQPEALVLARAMESLKNEVFDFTPVGTELRRLHQVNQELVEALKAMVCLHATPSTICKERPAFEQTLALIAKHKEQE